MPNADPNDVTSIDAIITAAYAVISGPAGKKRDWDRERSLYYPGARLSQERMTVWPPKYWRWKVSSRAWNRILPSRDFSKKKLHGAPNNSDTSLRCGARMNRVMTQTILSRSAAELTPSSCFTMAIVGGS